MWDYVKLALLGAIVIFAAIAANFARDLAFQVHAILIMLVAGGMFLWTLRLTDEPKPVIDQSSYMDGVIRYGVVATAFWGVIGFLVGVVIAFQLAFPALNFEWAQPYGNFGRLRPLHTSAVIFAFGGNALICTSFYVVQRILGARLWGGNPRLVPQLFISFWLADRLTSRRRYPVEGITPSRIMARRFVLGSPWLGSAYLAVLPRTIMKRKEPSHLRCELGSISPSSSPGECCTFVQQLSRSRSSIWGSKSVQVFSGVQDRMVQVVVLATTPSASS